MRKLYLSVIVNAQFADFTSANTTTCILYFGHTKDYICREISHALKSYPVVLQIMSLPFLFFNPD